MEQEDDWWLIIMSIFIALCTMTRYVSLVETNHSHNIGTNAFHVLRISVANNSITFQIHDRNRTKLIVMLITGHKIANNVKSDQCYKSRYSSELILNHTYV